MYALDDYDYELPQALIAQQPAVPRDRSRLMRLARGTGRFSHHRFDALGAMLAPGDVLVVNDTAVVPARLLGRKKSGGWIEVFLSDYAGGEREGPGGRRFTCTCLARSSKPPRVGTRVLFEGGLTGTFLAVEPGSCRVLFEGPEEFETLLERVGHVPLPPYIRRPDAPADRAGYQTVYAAARGAVAAPTAGLALHAPAARCVAPPGGRRRRAHPARRLRHLRADQGRGYPQPPDARRALPRPGGGRGRGQRRTGGRPAGRRRRHHRGAHPGAGRRGRRPAARRQRRAASCSSTPATGSRRSTRSSPIFTCRAPPC